MDEFDEICYLSTGGVSKVYLKRRAGVKTINRKEMYD